VHSLVFGRLHRGTYDLYVRPDGPIRLTVTDTGGQVAQAEWPPDGIGVLIDPPAAVMAEVQREGERRERHPWLARGPHLIRAQTPTASAPTTSIAALGQPDRSQRGICQSILGRWSFQKEETKCRREHHRKPGSQKI